MAPKGHTDDEKFCPGEKQQYVIFDCSNNLITAFWAGPNDHFGCFKRVATDGLENGRATKRTKTSILNTASGSSLTEVKDGSSNEDSDVKSDAESLPCFQGNGAADVSDDDEEWVNNLFDDDGTRKKLEVLAGLVGADSMEPGIVLAEVVNVLTDLTRRNGHC